MKTAADCFRMAATAGDIDAQIIIAYMCENGMGADVNMQEAEYWYRTAAQNGNKDAQAWLDSRG